MTGVFIYMTFCDEELQVFNVASFIYNSTNNNRIIYKDDEIRSCTSKLNDNNRSALSNR